VTQQSQQSQQLQPRPPAPGKKKKRPRTDQEAARITRTAAAIIVLGILGWFIVHAMNSGPQRDSAGNVTQPSFVNVTDIKVGDCFDSATSGDLSLVTEMPCGQSHTGQVLGFALMTDKTYPSQAALTNEANTDCAQYWSKVSTAGLPGDASNADLVPATQADFDSGDIKIACVEQSPSGQLVSSVLG
jgi:hypothetical protein